MILDDIVADKKKRLIEHKERISEEEMKKMALESKRETISFYKALKKDGLSIIGEFKKASPSMGVIKSKVELLDRIDAYNNSVDAISCLTEEDHFNGSAEYLKKIRSISNLPIIRKDFVIDEYQIYEAKVIGADAILLIAAILNDEDMKRFYDLAYSLSLDVLLEVHDEEEMERALKLDAKIIGVNNRNLKDFTIDLGATKRLRGMVKDKKDKVFVSESGVTQMEHIHYLKECDVDALLIGRAFMESEDPCRLALEYKRTYNGVCRPKVKICGLVNEEDAQIVSDSDADMAGFVVFYEKSKRNISIDRARELFPYLREGIAKVAVVVSPSIEQLKIIEQAGFDYIQIHGDVKQEVIDNSNIPVIRSYNGDTTVREESEKIAAYLYDGKMYGSGQTYDYSLLENIDRKDKAFMVAGGLYPENVAECVRILEPDIVDVSTGVEMDNGIGKDREKVYTFIKNAKNAI